MTPTHSPTPAAFTFRRHGWLLLAVVLITALPLWLIAGDFAGSDDQAKAAIGTLAPAYQPWFAPLLEPASNEIASLLFALQAALGAGVIGYYLGCAVTRERLRREQSDQRKAD